MLVLSVCYVAVMPDGTPPSTQSPRTTFRLMVASIAAPAFIGIVFAVAVPGLRLWRYYRAGSWQPASCSIERVSYYRERSTKGAYVDYVPDIAFSYVFAGARHVASTPNLTEVTFVEKGSLDRWLADFPPGSTRSCLVDPADPTRAVLVRNWTWGTLVLLLVILAVEGSLIFLVLFPLRSLRALKQNPSA